MRQVLTRNIIALLLSQILLITAFFPVSVAPASEGIPVEEAKLIEIYEKTQELMQRTSKPVWLRGPHLKEVFTKMGTKLNFYSFLSARQKELLKENPSKTQKEVENQLTDHKYQEVNRPGIIVETTKTYLLIYVLAMINIIYDDLHRFHIDPRLLNDQSTLKKLGEAVGEIFDSGELTSSLMMAGGTHKVFKGALDSLHVIVSDSGLRSIFKNILMHFATSLVSFAGWEFGAQLWKESANMLDFQVSTPEEKALLADRNHIFSMSYRALVAGRDDWDHKKQKAAQRIWTLSFKNLLYILFVDGNLRVRWIYNTLRHRLLSGNFVTLITSMSMGSAVGTTVFPFAGTILGMVFGITGGIISMAVREEHKNAITVFLKDQWLSLLDGWGRSSTNLYLRSGFEEGSNGNQLSSISFGKTFNSVLVERVSYRQKVVDVFIERLYYNHSLLVANSGYVDQLYRLLPISNRQQLIRDEVAEVVSKSKKNYIAMLSSLQSLVSFYLTEASAMARFRDSDKHKSVRGLLTLEMANNESLSSHFCSLTEALLMVDFVKDVNRDLSESGAYPEESSLRSLCKLEFRPRLKAYSELSPGDKEMFDSALRFLEKNYWAQFDEQTVSLDRVNELLSE